MPVTRGIQMHPPSPCGGLPTPALTCAPRGVHLRDQFPDRGGGGGAVGECQIQLRKIAGNCGKFVAPYPNPPQSRGATTSAQGTHRAPTRTRGGHAQSNCGRLVKHCEKLRNVADLNPPPTAHPHLIHSRPSTSSMAEPQHCSPPVLPPFFPPVDVWDSSRSLASPPPLS